MKAIRFTAHGPPEVLRLEEIPTPTPQDDQVLVRVYATTVNAMEWRVFTMPGWFIRLIGGIRKPRESAVGFDLAGRVEAIGVAVTQFQPGDEVFGLGKGAWAELVCAPAKLLAHKPATVSFEAAATAGVAALTALQGVRDCGGVQSGQRVLVHGAGGGVGTYAVQIAVALGAHVDGVCGPDNVHLVRSLGAARAIDYTREDFTRIRDRYDVVIVANGSRRMRDYRLVLAPTGMCVVLGGSIPRVLQAIGLGLLLRWRRRGQKVRAMIAKPNQADLQVLKTMLEHGTVAPAIDRTYPLAEAPAAVRYLMAGHARGKVVLTVRP